jgi:hypothetical protein
MDAIVCLDAIFLQKRCRTLYMDEPYVTNSSFFISNDVVHQMEEEVTSSQKSAKCPHASSGNWQNRPN